ncbi:molybdopterin molybdenumtransferase MoeA [Pyrococcus furiosus DSM 3638]|uniref:Molybdopterin molybdenumtransferase MoeA n=3 Tax=Pyrococcus furiosus TaxID=2261 RepID=A0A5C0XS12_PYRFU|nr:MULTISPECIES: gephyrin-like molybdotransferase Glp [Pyrococcus]AAL81907.1 molybdenum cofactor biosynthesis protein [Pyrococcus furiosus DSM 3638]AFN04858.1 molybdenum cofactor biosynthesis protein MoeA [Pyrococcus furiosus COM1]MDK2870253.1 molybdopterin molybdotransferase [Pyrococcus sp.]QEK79385.1 molybdopterin molybdenumtransferase MoeA [Pyrococcus furiosus DSM 3638]
MEFKRLTPYEEALSIVLNDLKEIEEVEYVPLKDALGRVLAEDIVASYDLPPFDRAAVDGYAVRAEDTFEAREYSPVELEVIEEVPIGENPNKEVIAGKAIKVLTGGKIPRGANAVIMQEMVKREGSKIYVLRPVAPGQNISFAGEDVKKGDIALKKGTILRPQDLALLKALGIRKVPVKVKPKVGIIITGSELVQEPSLEEFEKGKIVDTNSIMLSALVERYFGEPILYGVVPDNEDLIRSALEKAKRECDLVLITGGSAFGDMDYAHKFVNLLFHGTTIRPGRPIGYGERVFVMSGYPVAVFTQFHLFVKHALAKLVGAKDYEVKVRAVLEDDVPSQLGRYEFVRVMYRDGKAKVIKKKGSGIISSLVQSNAYLVVPEDVEGYRRGEEVWVTLY